MLLSLVNSLVGFMLLMAVFGSYFELLTVWMADPSTVAELADPAGLMLRLLIIMLLAVPIMWRSGSRLC